MITIECTNKLQEQLLATELRARKAVADVDVIVEATEIPVDATAESIIKMLDATKKAVSIINGLKDKAERKKHASRVFSNMNNIRKALVDLIRAG